jgi:hypothetical protein
MSSVLHEIAMSQAGEAEQPARLGVYLGSNVASQVRLSTEDLEIIRQLSPPQIVQLRAL